MNIYVLYVICISRGTILRVIFRDVVKFFVVSWFRFTQEEVKELMLSVSTGR